MENEELKNLKALIKYSRLLNIWIKLMIVPIITIIVLIIMMFAYRETGSDNAFSLLSIVSICAQFFIIVVVGFYSAIKFSSAQNKISSMTYSNMNTDIGEVNSNIDKMHTVNTVRIISDLVGLDNTNVGSAINALSYFEFLRLISKNNKLINKNYNIFTDKEKTKNGIVESLFISITLILSAIFIATEFISLENTKNRIQGTMDSLNTIIEKNYSDYQIRTGGGQNKISITGFDSLGKSVYLENNNYRIDFELNNDVQIKDFSFTIIYNPSDVLNENEIYNIFKELKNKFDNSFSSYYKLKEYADADIVFNEECSYVISNGIDKYVSLDTRAVDKPLRSLNLVKDNKSMKVIYKYYSY